MALALTSACGGLAVQRLDGDEPGGQGASGNVSLSTGGTFGTGGAPLTGDPSGTGGDYAMGGGFVGKVVWTVQLGTKQDDRPYGVGMDENGYVYVAGATRGYLPGYTNNGPWDSFLQKYDTYGELVSEMQFDGWKDNAAYALAVDTKGSTYMAGYANYLSPSGRDAYLSYTSFDGHEIWFRRLGSPEDDEARGVFLDGAGNLYLVGRTEGALPGHTSSGGADAFLAKYDATSGTELWTRQFGTVGDDVANAVTVGSNGDVYVAGNFDAKPGQLRAAGLGFLVQYDDAGTDVTTTTFGSGVVDAFALGADAQGNVFLGGRDSVDQRDGAGAFLTRYDEMGNPQTPYLIGAPSDEVRAISISDVVFAAGHTTESLLGFTNAGGYDAFVRGYASKGPTTWQFGTPGDDMTTAIVANPIGGAYVVGYTDAPLNNQKHLGKSDGFLVKLGP